MSSEGTTSAHQERPAPGPADGQVERALLASGIATYHWIIETDEMVWSANAAGVLGCDPAAIATGRAFASYLDPDNITSRYDAVMRTTVIDDGHGVPFQIEYKFRPEGRLGRAQIWLEDQGSWYGGKDGRPVEAYGTLRRIDARHQHDQHLSFLGNCDPLTGMMNRGRMAEALGEAMSVAQRDGTSCAFLVAAINNLSVVNEAYGFEVADEVVINMARRLRQVVRAGDAIGRYSGSKFGLILNNCGEEDLAVAAERFLSVARESVIETERGPVWALLSIGALILPAHAEDPNTAMARAEESLAEARRRPSDGYVVYRPSPERSSERALNARSATDTVRCLRENLFRLAFQPVVDAGTRQPLFHEALLRMVDPHGEVVTAAHLIPIAEKLGLVRLIDRAVGQMVVAALHRHPEARLSLNLSGTTATDPRWYPQIIEMLASNRAVTDRLTVEITETVALGDMRETLRFVEHLRELGCRVAIDDFGAGFTSFRNLRALPLDILKLDGTFCRDLSSNSDNTYFVRSLIDMARTFNIKTVAEWVETEADAHLLSSWGIDMMQGNLFGEALLESPWPAATDTGAAASRMPFVLPSEMSWDDIEDEAAATDTVQISDLPDAPAGQAVAWTPASAAPPPDPAVRVFEETLSGELSKLREAIAALDKALKSPKPGPAAAKAERRAAG